VRKQQEDLIDKIHTQLVRVISETNGLNLVHTLELLLYSTSVDEAPMVRKSVEEFQRLLSDFNEQRADIFTLLDHPVAEAFFKFFKEFPIPYREEHIHLTGSLTAEFIYPRLKKLLTGKNKKIYEKKIKEVYKLSKLEINSPVDIDRLIRLKDDEEFTEYLRILYLPKLILTDRKVHTEAAYHMAKTLYKNFNVGTIRLKFTLSRANNMASEQIPGASDVSTEDVVLGLYDGFMKFKKENPFFDFVLSPCFRKEHDFFDKGNFKTKEDHFNSQVDDLLHLIEKHPEVARYLNEVDTVGDEKELYRKKHFMALRSGFRKLQYKGFKIRSHHGETWHCLKRGIQAADNAMNIWHISTLEHGLSLGINPNYYFHRVFQHIVKLNSRGEPVNKSSHQYRELIAMDWHDEHVKEKLLKGKKLNQEEITSFLKTKFHTARELESYQHDVLNRMINKNISLVSLPSSNMKLTKCFPDYKDHPFSWWEKKGVNLGIGTDNYITLNTNFIQEMLIILFSDSENLKITKLLMIATKELRRPFISHLLWEMRKRIASSEE